MSSGSVTGTENAPLTADRRGQLGRRAQQLAGVSVAYNVVEAVVAVAAGAAASSIALVGFGLDSLVEVGSGLVILWQFRHAMPETREKQALRYIAISFFALSGYVTFESVRSLVGADDATTTGLGVGVAIASLVIMPLLSWAQRRTGRELGSGSVVADSKQTLLCTYLSAVLLLGLVLNGLFGWSWADPLAGLVIAAVALREGLATWRGDGCCAPGGVVHEADGGSNRPVPQEGEPGGCCGDGCGCATTPAGASDPRPGS